MFPYQILLIYLSPFIFQILSSIKNDVSQCCSYIDRIVGQWTSGFMRGRQKALGRNADHGSAYDLKGWHRSELPVKGRALSNSNFLHEIWPKGGQEIWEPIISRRKDPSWLETIATQDARMSASRIAHDADSKKCDTVCDIGLVVQLLQFPIPFEVRKAPFRVYLLNITLLLEHMFT
jgi:hypothetical protein